MLRECFVSLYIKISIYDGDGGHTSYADQKKQAARNGFQPPAIWEIL